MENKIDDIYLPIEIMYEKLKSYDLRLARAELKQVGIENVLKLRLSTVVGFCLKSTF